MVTYILVLLLHSSRVGSHHGHLNVDPNFTQCKRITYSPLYITMCLYWAVTHRIHPISCCSYY